MLQIKLLTVLDVSVFSALFHPKRVTSRHDERQNRKKEKVQDKTQCCLFKAKKISQKY